MGLIGEWRTRRVLEEIDSDESERALVDFPIHPHIVADHEPDVGVPVEHANRERSGTAHLAPMALQLGEAHVAVKVGDDHRLEAGGRKVEMEGRTVIEQILTAGDGPGRSEVRPAFGEQYRRRRGCSEKYATREGALKKMIVATMARHSSKCFEMRKC